MWEQLNALVIKKEMFYDELGIVIMVLNFSGWLLNNTEHCFFV